MSKGPSRTFGPTRPIVPFMHRAKAVSYMGVDYVVEISDDTEFLELVAVVKPDVRVLSDEYRDRPDRPTRPSRIPRVPVVWGPRIPGSPSTTELIERCRG